MTTKMAQYEMLALLNQRQAAQTHPHHVALHPTMEQSHATFPALRMMRNQTQNLVDLVIVHPELARRLPPLLEEVWP